MRFPAEAFRGGPEGKDSGSEFERGEMGMKVTRRLAGPAMIATLFLIAGSGMRAFAQAPAAGQDANGAKYTQAGIKAEQTLAAEKGPAAGRHGADPFCSNVPDFTLPPCI